MPFGDVFVCKSWSVRPTAFPAVLSSEGRLSANARCRPTTRYHLELCAVTKLLQAVYPVRLTESDSVRLYRETRCCRPFPGTGAVSGNVPPPEPHTCSEWRSVARSAVSSDFRSGCGVDTPTPLFAMHQTRS